METRNQRLIREILGEQHERSDTSLRAQAFKRANADEVPRTLTPFEWEQWQAEHGIPASLRTQEAQATRKTGWLRRLLGSED